MTATEHDGKKRKAEGGDRDRRDDDGPQRKRWQARGQIGGPGIFVSCVRGRERKAAQELIEYLEEIAERIYPNVKIVETEEKQQEEREGEEIDEDALRNGEPTMKRRREEHADEEKEEEEEEEDIEAQIKAELADIKGKGKGKTKRSGDPKTSARTREIHRFSAILTDVECLVFVGVAKPLDPVVLTCTLLDEVKRTGQARSRYVHRLAPVVDVVRAEMDALEALAVEEIERRIVVDDNDASSTPPLDKTFKVEVKMRQHTRLTKMDVVRALAARMPPTYKAQLNAPSWTLNVEIHRMQAGLAVLPHYEHYRRYNPIMLAEETQNARQGDDDQLSRIKTTAKE